MQSDCTEELEHEVSQLSTAVELFSRRGIIAILTELARGPKRHNELGRQTGLENKQLSRALHHAETAGLVSRKVYEETKPVKVMYDLTRRGEGLVRALRILADAWGVATQPAAGVGRPAASSARPGHTSASPLGAGARAGKARDE